MVRAGVAKLVLVVSLTAAASAEGGAQTLIAADRFLSVVSQIAASDPALEEALGRARRSLAVVFVPGILGSALRVRGTNEVLWGQGMPLDPVRLSHDLALPKAILELEPDIETNVEATVLRQIQLLDTIEPIRGWATFDGYGGGTDALRNLLKPLDIPLVECGYDWRRDIRAAAHEVERCVQAARAALNPRPEGLIVIGHSMGGLVTWSWRKLYPDRPDRRVHAMVTVGSPLAGSCELLRMIAVGYQQPTSDWAKAERPGLFANWWSRAKGHMENGLSALITGYLRPTILSWPGAIELTPHPDDAESQNRSCLPFRIPGETDNSSRAFSYYSEAFWQGEPGRDVLEGLLPPDTVGTVLETARQFRVWFDGVALDIPLVLYTSTYWSTPGKFRVAGGRAIDRSAMTNDDLSGDGRVSSESATGGFRKLDGKIQPYRLEYVHGSQIDDPRFQETIVQDVVGPIRAGVMAMAAVDYVRQSSDRIARYRSANGVHLPWREVRRLLDPAPVMPARPRALPASLVEHKRGVIDLNRKLLGRTTQADIKAARQAYNAETDSLKSGLPNVGNEWALRFAALTEILIEDDIGGEAGSVQNLARLGNALVESRNYAAAVVPLGAAIESWERIPVATYTSKGQTEIEGLRIATEVNLGVALYESGQCEDARHWLDWYSWKPAVKQRLAKPCVDKITGDVRG